MKKKIGVLTISHSQITKVFIFITFIILFRLNFYFPAVLLGADLKESTHNQSAGTIEDTDVFVWKGDYTIKTQDDIEKISGYRVVTGSLNIKDTNLHNLDGMESLIEVGFSLTISRNKYLSNFNGLSNLSSAMRIIINDNGALENINGLGILESVEDLMIFCNDNLSNIDGFNAITSLSGVLWINYNAALTSLSGLRNLSKIGEDLVIVGNSALSTLDLSSLTYIGRDLYIYDNVHLPITMLGFSY